jgi:hypothetical protein
MNDNKACTDERIKCDKNATKNETETETEAPRENVALDEAGSIGDEQCPAGIEKTDKAEWNYASTKVKKESILPEGLRKFLNGL